MIDDLIRGQANRLRRTAELDTIHRVIADAAFIGIAVGIGWSALVAVSGRTGGPAFERFQAALVSLLIVVAASGLLMLATGARPADGLHLLYAVIAIALIPLARSFTGRTTGRATAALLVAAFVVLGAIGYRLLATG